LDSQVHQEHPTHSYKTSCIALIKSRFH
jgi:hypothetical protein